MPCLWDGLTYQIPVHHDDRSCTTTVPWYVCAYPIPHTTRASDSVDCCNVRSSSIFIFLPTTQKQQKIFLKQHESRSTRVFSEKFFNSKNVLLRTYDTAAHTGERHRHHHHLQLHDIHGLPAERICQAYLVAYHVREPPFFQSCFPSYIV